MQKNSVSLHLAGKVFQVPCLPDDAPDLLLAANAVNDALNKTQLTQSFEVRLLMVALNLSYELLQTDRFNQTLETDVRLILGQVQDALAGQSSVVE
jgi:cell division protein ZapA (FtsZ GTPase activity inhibitor)